MRMLSSDKIMIDLIVLEDFFTTANCLSVMDQITPGLER